MFCSECGSKNKDGSLFCENCGHKFEETVKKENKTKKEPTKQQGKKSITKYIIISVVVLLVGAYLLIDNMFSPTKVAEGYFNAVTNLDADKLYGYLDVEESEFTSKKVFKDIINSEKESKKEIVNYNVDKVEKSTDGMSASVTIKYMLKDSKDSSTLKIDLVKSKNKKWLLFDNWKVNTGDYVVVKDYKFNLPTGSKLTIEGKKVDKKYLKETEDGIDTYVIPALFATNYNVKVELMGLEIENKVKINSYSAYNLDFTGDNISAAGKEKIQKAIKTSLENLYNGAKDKKTWDEVKSNFEYKNGDVSKVEKAYNDLLSSFSNSSSTLNSITFTKIELSSASLNKKGQLYISVKASYDFSLSYQSGDETKTNDSDDYDYMYLTFDYSDNAFKLVDATSLNTYFSKYY